MRRHPAIEFTWASRPDDEEIDRLVARLDDGSLLAIDDQGLSWRAFFDSPEARTRALASLEGAGPSAGAHAVDIDDEDWAARSQAGISAVRVGSLLVTPPWQLESAAAREPGIDHVIVINPSMGFGTGHHASTRRCLALLARAPVEGRSVIDVGTGSAVLAIAAWKLGAASVDAVDIDADALVAAADSLERNAAGAAIRLVQADLAGLASGTLRQSYDVIVANLTGATLERHAATLASLGHAESWLIASGIETHEADAVITALSQHGWQVVHRDTEEGWVGLSLVRPATTPTASTGS